MENVLVARRTYLSLVYPTAVHFKALSESAVHGFLATRWWFYHNVSEIEHISYLGLSPSQLLGGSFEDREHWDCPDGFHEKLLIRDHFSRFPGVFPCSSFTQCLQRQARYRPPWVDAIMHSPASVTFLEVWHLAFNSKGGSRKPTAWGDFLDRGSPSFLWFRLAPGSGIFYHAGKTLARPGKNAMLVALLEEWCRGNSSDATLSELTNVARASSSNRVCTLIPRWNATVDGSTTCQAAGLHSCRDQYILNDNWDLDLTALARALGYDTLLFTASFFSPESGATAELVDLRNRPTQSPDDVIDALVKHSPLSLRDPLDVQNTAAATPCRFSDEGPSLRLACKGHVSWALRDEPKLQKACTARPSADSGGKQYRPQMQGGKAVLEQESVEWAPAEEIRGDPNSGMQPQQTVLGAKASSVEPVLGPGEFEALSEIRCPKPGHLTPTEENAAFDTRTRYDCDGSSNLDSELIYRAQRQWISGIRESDPYNASVSLEAGVIDASLSSQWSPYLLRVYGADSSFPLHRISSLGFFWASAPARSTFMVSWRCPWDSASSPLYASLVEAALNPNLIRGAATKLNLSETECGSPGLSADRIPSSPERAQCERDRILKPGFESKRLHFPGFFVRNYNGEAHQRVHGLRDNSWVEVMRVTRIDPKRAPKDRCTLGQVWFWLASGSGVWWQTGRSIRVPTEATAIDCATAHARGYDSIQMLQSNSNQLPIELIDCRGASLTDALTTPWESACPPNHVSLRTGLPAREGLPNGTSPPPCSCACDPCRGYINCLGSRSELTRCAST